MTDELSKGFTGIEINGVRFSNIKEMLIYMNKQRDHILDLEKENEIFKKANEIIAQQRDDRDADISKLENQIEDLEAQVEKTKWHKVSDGDLPKDRHNVYVVYMNGYCQLEKTIASFRHKYWVFNGLKTECEIIAWCELPEWR